MYKLSIIRYLFIFYSKRDSIDYSISCYKHRDEKRREIENLEKRLLHNVFLIAFILPVGLCSWFCHGQPLRRSVDRLRYIARFQLSLSSHRAL